MGKTPVATPPSTPHSESEEAGLDIVFEIRFLVTYHVYNSGRIDRRRRWDSNGDYSRLSSLAQLLIAGIVYGIVCAGPRYTYPVRDGASGARASQLLQTFVSWPSWSVL